MKHLIYLCSVILTIGFMSCNSLPEKKEPSKTIQKTEIKSENQLPPYSVRLSEVEFTQPLEDLQFYDQILEVRNNHISILEMGAFAPRNILVLIDENDSLSNRNKLRTKLLSQIPIDLQTDISVHYLVKNQNTGSLGILSEVFERNYERYGCGGYSLNRITLHNDSIFSYQREGYLISNIKAIFDSLRNTELNLLNSDLDFKRSYIIRGQDSIHFKDLSRLKHLYEAIDYINKTIPIHTDIFQLEIRLPNYSFSYSKYRKYNPPKIKFLLRLLSQIRNMEYQNLKSINELITKYEKNFGSLLDNEKKLIIRRASINIKLLSSPPPPPPPPIE